MRIFVLLSLDYSENIVINFWLDKVIYFYLIFVSCLKIFNLVKNSDLLLVWKSKWWTIYLLDYVIVISFNKFYISCHILYHENIIYYMLYIYVICFWQIINNSTILFTVVMARPWTRPAASAPLCRRPTPSVSRCAWAPGLCGKKIDLL